MSAFPDTPVKLLRKLSAQPPAPEQESDWAQFVEMYEPVIRAFVAAEDLQPADVDDAVQNVFVRLLGIMRRDGYDRSRGRFRTYLRTIMRRVLIDFFRRQTAERFALHTPFNEDETQADEGLEEQGASQSPDAAAAFEAKLRQAEFRALLNHVFTQTALSDQSREIYRAYALEEGDAQEVARRFGVTPEVVRQVKSRVNRMIAALARRLAAE